MSPKIQEAIKALGRQVSEHYWSLHHGAIRCSAIADTEDHAEVTLCPLAMAVTCVPSERIAAVLNDPEHESFARVVNEARPGLREQLELEDPSADAECLDADATDYAVAVTIHDGPQQPPAAQLLGLDADALRAISDGADHPDSEAGRALVIALDSSSNELRREYEAVYGKIA
jgi:hypothetical protein